MKTERMPHKPRRAGFNPRTARRLLGYVFRPYKVQMAVVLVCILVSALAGVAGSMFLQPLIDNFIPPPHPERDPRLRAAGAGAVHHGRHLPAGRCVHLAV